MIVVGLTGSIAAGKTEAANVFRNNGVPVFDADAEVRDFYESPQGVAAVEKIVPQAIQNGHINRERLAEAVLGHHDQLARLEACVHPVIASRRSAFLETARSQGHTIVVFDVPLLFETGTDREVDVTLVVSAREDLRRNRALARPGMTIEKLKNIMARQMPDAEKRALADYVVENNGTREKLHAAVNRFLKEIRAKARDA
jgi:dephospho-CoA kinase